MVPAADHRKSKTLVDGTTKLSFFFEFSPTSQDMGLEELGEYCLRVEPTTSCPKAWDPEEVLRWQGLWFYYTWWVRDRLELKTAGEEIIKRDSSCDMLIFADFRSVFEYKIDQDSR